MKKESICIVADEKTDKDIIDFLLYKYEISDIISIPDFLIKVDEAYEEERRLEINPEFIIINNDSSKHLDILFEIFYENYGEISRFIPKFLAFGTAAIALGKMNNCIVLTDVNNHNNTSHLTTFCMNDDKLLDFTVRSNHNELLYPTSENGEILAFSTHNLSSSYTDSANNNTFKAKRNFLEVEGIKFRNTKCYCFMYEPPNSSESVLIDITSQFLRND